MDILKNENINNYISRCLNDKNIIKGYPDFDRRLEYVINKAVSSLNGVEAADFMFYFNELGNEEELRNQFDNDLHYNDYHEWFVDKFIAYLKAKIQNYNLQMDLSFFLKNENKVVSKMLDSFFAETEYSARLKFLQTILSLE